MDASTRQVRMGHVTLVVESLDRADMGDHRIQYLGSGTASDSNSSSICRGGSLGRWSTYRDGHTVWDVADLSPVAARVESLGARSGREPTRALRLGFYSAPIRDPDGIEVELIQRV